MLPLGPSEGARAQHRNGLEILNSFKELFGEGSVVQKSGSPDIFVYTLPLPFPPPPGGGVGPARARGKGYKKIIKEVLPFLETYMSPFSCKMEEYSIFKQIVLQSCPPLGRAKGRRKTERQRNPNRASKTSLYFTR